ncbi:MAG: sigma-70 family RNA polymerase sigma factor [Clostridia bacterium]|nr:sigma-70 family RNA polymerase sigma factor [Clostridia bacterium]
MTSDLELVSRAKEGDRQAFETLVSRYESKIYHMALRYTGDAQEALDITQEVFLRMYRGLYSCQQDCNVSVWLYRLTDLVCKDAVRQISSRAVLSEHEQDSDEPYEIEIPDLRYNPESVYDRAALRDTIVDAVSALPEHLRKVIVLREIAGMTYEEISDCLELELGTVKSRIARGRDKLRSFLSRPVEKKETETKKPQKGGGRK